MRQSLMAIALLGMFGLVGCDQQQYDEAVENQQEESAELEQEKAQATADGTITADELEEVEDQADEVEEATGEVAEQAGDLIESETD